MPSPRRRFMWPFVFLFHTGLNTSSSPFFPQPKSAAAYPRSSTRGRAGSARWHRRSGSRHFTRPCAEKNQHLVGPGHRPHPAQRQPCREILRTQIITRLRVFQVQRQHGPDMVAGVPLGGPAQRQPQKMPQLRVILAQYGRRQHRTLSVGPVACGAQTCGQRVPRRRAAAARRRPVIRPARRSRRRSDPPPRPGAGRAAAAARPARPARAGHRHGQR